MTYLYVKISARDSHDIILEERIIWYLRGLGEKILLGEGDFNLHIRVSRTKIDSIVASAKSERNFIKLLIKIYVKVDETHRYDA